MLSTTTIPHSTEASCGQKSRYLKSAFHQIDCTYPGLSMISEEPYIFLVHDFISASEADALVSKIDSSDAAPSSQKLNGRGERTSVSTLIHDQPDLRARIAQLTRVSQAQLQPLKLTRYDEGGVFMQHTDCSVWINQLNDPLAQSGQCPTQFPNRFCTVLVYLNDCAEGGSTCWNWRDTDSSVYSASSSNSFMRLAAELVGRASTRSPFTRGRQEAPRCGERAPLRIAPRRGTAVPRGISEPLPIPTLFRIHADPVLVCRWSTSPARHHMRHGRW